MHGRNNIKYGNKFLPKPRLILPNLPSTLWSTKLIFSLSFCYFRGLITITFKMKTCGLNSADDVTNQNQRNTTLKKKSSLLMLSKFYILF